MKLLLLMLSAFLSGCAGMAMDAAREGDLESLRRNIEYVDDPVEKKRIWDAYFENYCHRANSGDTTMHIFGAGLCYRACATERYCDKEKGIRLIVHAAQAGDSEAIKYLVELGVKPPPLDPDLVVLYQNRMLLKAQERQANAVESALINMNRRSCTSKWVGSEFRQVCQ